jgi:hypothetical protein
MTIDYPLIGSIVTLSCGTHVQVWPAESDDPRCFTGEAIGDDASVAAHAVHNCSCLWLRSAIVRVDEPQRGGS